MQTAAPNAALLIDFDNVTMGMRSDLSKELKTLLGSDIIRGKVTVQRAYADWRRYPQYIVPLSESSIDLIFAPAYGSNKKNATDIRMAIDGMELVFTRPEIGTFILLTGDSDFSSLVLKLKEYGKYVIGVGIQESSSDILVQNCDEYYSYTNLSGLRKTTDSDRSPVDPWVLVEQAVKRMADRDDVMRSDRLKQVMLEIDPGFDEGSFGFTKFSRFVTEASSKGLLQLKKMDNGQYEVSPGGSGGGGGGGGSRRGSSSSSRDRDERGGRGGRNGGRGRDRERGGRRDRDDAPRPEQEQERDKPAAGTGESTAAPSTPPPSAPAARDGDPLQHAYRLLTDAVSTLVEERGTDAIRDSDVKRKMLEVEGDFDEAELGFTKFSRFLRQAHDHDVIILRKRETGNYEVALPEGGAARGGSRDTARAGQRDGGSTPDEGGRDAGSRDRGRSPDRAAAEADEAPPVLKGQGVPSDQVEIPTGPAAPSTSRATAADAGEEAPEGLLGALGRRLGLRLGSTRRRDAADEQPSLLDGQAMGPPSGSTTAPTESPSRPAASKPAASAPSTPPATSKPAAPSRDTGRDAGEAARPAAAAAGSGVLDPSELGLPTDADAQVRYLANSYKGVGTKTAESLVEGLGEDLFTVLQEEPERVKDVISPARAEAVLDQWKVDFERRRSRAAEESDTSPSEGGDAGRGGSDKGGSDQGGTSKGGSGRGGSSRGGSGRGSGSRGQGEGGRGGRSGGSEAPSGGAAAKAGAAARSGSEGTADRGEPSSSGDTSTRDTPEADAHRPGTGKTERTSEASDRPGTGKKASDEPAGDEAAPKGGATVTVGGVEIPADAEPSPLRGRRGGRRR